jgi:1-deoxy-D-xylulose-5-phosphate reductoisomerase
LALDLPKLDLAALGQLEFFQADAQRFPALRLVRQALAAGDSGAIAFNAANEVAVERFRQGEIGFLEIAETVEEVLNSGGREDFSTLKEILDYDAKVRQSTGAKAQRHRG